MDRESAKAEARRLRKIIKERLEEENEQELETRIEKCGLPLNLICTACGHCHATETSCRQKWCPVCARAIAARRSMKYAAAVAGMEWPLFVTLTMKNVPDLDHDAVRKLRRAFGKLRHRRIWKDTVSGGVAGIEVTNIGHGWHPHLHAAIDCRWLSVTVPRPQPGESRDSVKGKCKRAKHELSKLWAKCLKEKHGVCWVKRTAGPDIVQEVLKYSVKGSDLANSPDPIGPIIHALCATRLTTSFGNLFGKLRVKDELKTPATCDACHQPASWMPEPVLEAIQRGLRHQK